MLNKFRKAKQPEIDRLLELEASDALPRQYEGQRPAFGKALQEKAPVAVIAEFKPASPSMGAIRADADPCSYSRSYANGGAAAMSVLTENVYFGSGLPNLACAAEGGLPLLRKDFIFHELQVVATAATPASAILLIARMFAASHELAALVKKAETLGLEPLVEIFDEADLHMAREAGARLIQVNNRDLDTLAIDHEASMRLIKDKREGEIWICASGISSHADVRRAGEAGYDAVLVGTALMQADDPEQAVRALLGEAS